MIQSIPDGQNQVLHFLLVQDHSKYKPHQGRKYHNFMLNLKSIHNYINLHLQVLSICFPMTVDVFNIIKIKESMISYKLILNIVLADNEYLIILAHFKI